MHELKLELPMDPVERYHYATTKMEDLRQILSFVADVRRRALLELVETRNMSTADLATLFHVSRQTIHRALAEARENDPRRDTPREQMIAALTSEQVELLKAFIDQSEMWWAIAANHVNRFDDDGPGVIEDLDHLLKLGLLDVRGETRDGAKWPIYGMANDGYRVVLDRMSRND
jgi:hypothetical protein